MNNREILEFTLNKLMQKGAQKAELSLQVSEKEELETASGKLNLFRTTQEKNLNLTVLIDDKKGSVQINKLAKDEILEAVDQVIEIAGSSQADPANDIAPLQTPEQFTRGPEKPDHDLMYDRLNDFLIFTRERFPKIILEQVILDFNISYNNYLNSNGVDFSSRESGYNFFPMFTAKDGEKTSSFNYTAVSSKNLDRELANWGVTADLLAQSSEQVDTSALEKKFVGDIIVTPDCLGEFIGYLTAYLREYSLISGNSIYLNKLGEKIAHEQLSLHSKPLSDELDEGYFFTQDGFKVSNSSIINKGVLNSYLLGLYGSLKTGLPKADNSGGCYVIDPGDFTRKEMISSIDRGILLCRFSGGNPNDKGDFSGVAKNSYYIEKGEIKYPIRETMIAGNLVEMMLKIKSISRERVNFGYKIYPWICFSGVNVSGK